jgi:hypothetical protein
VQALLRVRVRRCRLSRPITDHRYARVRVITGMRSATSTS